jgi:predicted outer membrane protein
MNFEDIIKENKLLKETNENLVKDLEDTKEHLKKYTSPSYKKQYYENNKDQIKIKIREYRQTYQPTEVQKKKWARTAYLNKKAKLELEKSKLENVNI